MRAVLALALIGCATPQLGAGVDRVAYPDGKARFEFELRDGLPNGRGRSWYANGKLASDGTYRDGGREGRFWFYDDTGAFVGQGFYVDNAEVWHSADEHELPPAQWTKGAALAARAAPTDATSVDVEVEPDVPWAPDKHLRPYFSTMDRTTAPARAGAQLGVGEAKDLGFGATTRFDVFGHYRIGTYGLFAQLTETRLALPGDMTLGGRRTATVAGTYHRRLGPGTLSTTGGLLASVGNADAPGLVASAAGIDLRATDAAFAMPAPFGVRSGASYVAARGPFLVQADAGIDWLFGGDEHGFDPLGHANLGIGFGSHTTMVTAELANALRFTGTQSYETVALGGTLVYASVWITASLGFSFSGTTSFLGSVGYDL
jgi:hypothetical protein